MQLSINVLKNTRIQVIGFVESKYRSLTVCVIARSLQYRGLTGRFLLLQNFSVAISVSPHVCFILVLILISVFLR